MKKYQIDNKGFSLVELIVVVLVTSILMLGVTMFVSTSRSMYQTVNSSAKLQEESTTAQRVLSEFMMEAMDYGLVGNTDSDGDGKADGISIGTSDKAVVFWAIARENEGTDKYSLYFFPLDLAKNELRYCKVGPNDLAGLYTYVNKTTKAVDANGATFIATNCFGADSKYKVVANYVTALKKTSIQRPDGTDLVCIEMHYDYAGKTYTDYLTAVTRNKNREVVTPTPETPTPGTENPD